MKADIIITKFKAIDRNTTSKVRTTHMFILQTQLDVEMLILSEWFWIELCLHVYVLI